MSGFWCQVLLPIPLLWPLPASCSSDWSNAGGWVGRSWWKAAININMFISHLWWCYPLFVKDCRAGISRHFADCIINWPVLAVFFLTVVGNMDKRQMTVGLSEMASVWPTEWLILGTLSRPCAYSAIKKIGFWNLKKCSRKRNVQHLQN